MMATSNKKSFKEMFDLVDIDGYKMEHLGKDSNLSYRQNHLFFDSKATIKGGDQHGDPLISLETYYQGREEIWQNKHRIVLFCRAMDPADRCFYQNKFVERKRSINAIFHLAKEMIQS